MHRPQHLALHPHRPATEQPQLDLGLPLLETPPDTIEAVAVGILGIQHQPVGVDQIGLVDRVRPAERGAETMQDEGRAGEHAARHVPTRLGPQTHLVPGQRAFVGLVRVDEQARRPVRRARGSDGHRVGAATLGDLRAGGGCEQRADLPLETEEERREEHESGCDVIGPERLEARHDLLGMQGGIEVDPVGVALQHRPQLG